MFLIHEGEVILKEKYGSSLRERFYIRPPEQTNLVVLDNGTQFKVTDWLAEIFLPQGYPDSVSKDYLAYQVWDTAQAFCSTITGTLATQEVLKGVGVGDTSATPLAATVTWVIKDGCGHIGRILFAYSHGTHLDAFSKKWRLYADVLNDAAMCMEIALPLFKNYTTFALCVSTVMKAIVGVTGGATRAAMTQHHAVRGNLADVSAKDSAQETAVNLVASITALLIMTSIGNSIFVFMLMMFFHIVFNYLAVRSVCLRTFNEPRYLQVIDNYLRNEVISTPCEVNQREPIIFYQRGLLDVKLCGFKIKLGYSIEKLIKMNPKARFLSSLKEIFENRQYLLYPNISERKMYVLIKNQATNDDLLCAYFHAVLLSIVISALNDVPLAIYQPNSEDKRPFTLVVQTLQSAEWSRQPTEKIGISGFVYEPSVDLMKYLDQTTQKEWRRIKFGLAKTGWDITNHLLITDEWRIHEHKLEKEYVQLARNQASETLIPRFVSFNQMSDLPELTDKQSFIIEPTMTASASSVLEEKEERACSSKNNLSKKTEPVSKTLKII